MKRHIWLWLAAAGCFVGFLAVGGTPAKADSLGSRPETSAAAAAVVPPVTRFAASSVTDHSLTLSWTWPAATSVTRLVIRFAKGTAAPAGVTAGTAAGTVTRPGRKLTVGRLAPDTSYAFAAYARNKSGQYAKRATLLVVTKPAPLEIVTPSLPAGTGGLFYIVRLTASGGVAPYTWAGSGLPSGLALSRAGVVTGYPRGTGAKTVTLRARDKCGTTVTRKLRLSVPDSLPAACVAKSCAQLSRNTYTLQAPAKDLVSVARSAKTGRVTTVVLSGITVTPGDILVLAPDGDPVRAHRGR